MIEAEGLTKSYGGTKVVDDLSFRVEPGVVTGFLGPNGAGKSTTMRMILGLDSPSAGSASVNGRAYRDLDQPMREVGAMLDSDSAHPSMTAKQHLTWLAKAGNIKFGRVEEVLDMVGLGGTGRKRIGEFSLGMRQRLGVAAALLGDPKTLLLDEPVNGLDPEGVLWIRNLMKDMADEGRTVFVSSHLMSEMEATASHVVVIGRGRLIADMEIEELMRGGDRGMVKVVSPKAGDLRDILRSEGVSVERVASDTLGVRGLESARIGEIAAASNIPLHELTPEKASLESVFMELTQDSTTYRAADNQSGRERAVARERK